MPRLTSEAFGGGDQSWLGSSHSIANCRTETLDISAFTKATHYPDGFIPSGTPVCKTGGVLVPLTGDNAADFAGREEWPRQIPTTRSLRTWSGRTRGAAQLRSVHAQNSPAASRLGHPWGGHAHCRRCPHLRRVAGGRLPV